MYTDINFKTKKALIDAVKAGKYVTYYQPNGMYPPTVLTGNKVFLEGPHHPAAHTWYATAIVQDGKIISVK